MLDVATGTGAVARELVRQKGCSVVGVDQSPDMLAEARRRVNGRIELVEASADSLPFADGEFDALTFTYLLRYVDDPPATLARAGARRPARRRRSPGSSSAFPSGLWRPLWELHVRVGAPARRRWRSETAGDEVGSFLGPSIRGHYRAWPLPRLLEAWRDAGIEDVQARRLSLGGGVVTWGRRTGA